MDKITRICLVSIAKVLITYINEGKVPVGDYWNLDRMSKDKFEEVK